MEERDKPPTVCRRILQTTMGMPCSHKLEEILATGRDQLTPDDFHIHWHLSRTNSANIEPPNPVATIQSPRHNCRAILLPSRTADAPQNSTQRALSQFEIAEQAAEGQVHGRRRGRGRPRGRGSGRGNRGRGVAAALGGNARDIDGGEDIGRPIAGNVSIGGGRRKGRPPGSRNKRGNANAPAVMPAVTGRVYETRWGPRTDAPNMDTDSD